MVKIEYARTLLLTLGKQPLAVCVCTRLEAAYLGWHSEKAGTKFERLYDGDPAEGAGDPTEYCRN